MSEEQDKIDSIDSSDYDSRKDYESALKPHKAMIRELKQKSKSHVEYLKSQHKKLKDKLLVVKKRMTGKKSELVKELKAVRPDLVLWDVEIKKYYAKNKGKQHLKKDQWKVITEISKNFFNHDFATFFKSLYGQVNVTYVWQDSETGTLCKANVDSVFKNGSAFIIKAVDDASEKGFVELAQKERLYVETAHILNGANEINGLNLSSIVYILCETKPPFSVGFYRLNKDWELLGFFERKDNIESFNSCLVDDEWPTYSRGLFSPSVPDEMSSNLHLIPTELRNTFLEKQKTN